MRWRCQVAHLFRIDVQGVFAWCWKASSRHEVLDEVGRRSIADKNGRFTGDCRRQENEY